MVMFLDQFVQWVIAPLFAALLQHLVAMVLTVSGNQSSILHLAHTLKLRLSGDCQEIVMRLSGGCKGTTKQNLTNNTMTWIVMPCNVACIFRTPIFDDTDQFLLSVM